MIGGTSVRRNNADIESDARYNLKLFFVQA